jgi:hypothetical protein
VSFVTNASASARPPRLAAWLVDLFASVDHAEALLGDLSEEFSDVASKSGVVCARRWYWRQAAKTIAHLAAVGFRLAPWSLTGAVFLGFALRWFGSSLPERFIITILRAQRPYSDLHYDYYVWLVTWGIPIAGVVEMTLIGCVVATIAKGREIVASVVLGTVWSVWSVTFALLFFLRTPDLRPSNLIPWTFLLLRNFESWMAIVLGGILIRKIRSTSVRQHSTP